MKTNRFAALLSKVSKTRKFQRPALLLVFDPGETTGWALFNEEGLLKCGHLDTSDLSSIARELYAFIINHIPLDMSHNSLVLYENYRVYGHKRNQHVGSELHTTKLIGVIEAVCQMLNIPTYTQMAATAKPFCTDQKLREWGWFQTNKRHANDAIRHGAYYLLFGGKNVR